MYINEQFDATPIRHFGDLEEGDVFSRVDDLDSIYLTLLGPDNVAVNLRDFKEETFEDSELVFLRSAELTIENYDGM